MAITYSIDRLAGVLTITVRGSTSHQHFTDHYRETAADPEFSPDMDRLILIEEDATFPTGIEISGIAPQLRARGQDLSYRVAVVCPDPVPDGVTKLAVLSGARERIVFFPEKAAAISWLGSATKSAG